ncbi:MAG: nucleotide exchange factor GrpE [bacterium]|nr:nucleotide exchange factor GrpE [bacterium]
MKEEKSNNDKKEEIVKETEKAEIKSQKEEAGEFEKIKKELEEKSKLFTECSDSLLRLRAEFENFRKRSEREKAEIFRFSQEALIKELFLMIDNFELALGAAEKNKDFDNFHKGVDMIYKELKKILEKEGVVEIKAEGSKIDPHQHEVISHEPGDGNEEEVVVGVIRKGYMMNEKVLRPAMVKVGIRQVKNNKDQENLKK